MRSDDEGDGGYEVVGGNDVVRIDGVNYDGCGREEVSFERMDECLRLCTRLEAGALQASARLTWVILHRDVEL